MRNKSARPTAPMEVAGAPTSLRERKKFKTREAIADMALGLFIERGFDQVTVAEIARAADVSANTIFNYFHTKEEVFFDRQAQVEESWSRVVRERAPGESVVAALRHHLLAALARRDPASWLNDELVAFARVIHDSPALQAREREIGEHAREALARTLAAETAARPNDLRPRVVAAMVQGLYQTLFTEIRRRLLAGERADAIYPQARAATQQAFDLLESGLANYGVKPG